LTRTGSGDCPQAGRISPLRPAWRELQIHRSSSSTRVAAQLACMLPRAAFIRLDRPVVVLSSNSSAVRAWKGHVTFQSITMGVTWKMRPPGRSRGELTTPPRCDTLGRWQSRLWAEALARCWAEARSQNRPARHLLQSQHPLPRLRPRRERESAAFRWTGFAPALFSPVKSSRLKP
jgi:hypothetical protein